MVRVFEVCRIPSEIGSLQDAQGAAEAAEFILVGYDIRPDPHRGQLDFSRLTRSAVGSIGFYHLSSAHVIIICDSSNEAVVVDGHHLQSREISSLMEGVQLTLCLIAEEAEVRVVHVAGWAGWVKRGDTVVEAEREAYVGNATTRPHALRRI